MVDPILFRRRVRVNQDTQRTTVNDQPRDKSAEHGRAEDVDLEHGNGVGAHWFFPKRVYA